MLNILRVVKMVDVIDLAMVLSVVILILFAVVMRSAVLLILAIAAIFAIPVLSGEVSLSFDTSFISNVINFWSGKISSLISQFALENLWNSITGFFSGIFGG